MKKLLLILLCLPMIGFGQACQYGSSTDASELCEFFKGNSFSTYKNADIALEKVLSVTGMSKRFVLMECNDISNCVATSYKGVRYILYNRDFIDAIAVKTNEWSNISILAHEIGHHVNGHSLDLVVYSTKSAEPPTLAESRQMELEADEYSGFVMYKLGASLSQTQEAVKLVSTNDDDTYSTHPSKKKRLSAIAKGYKRAKKQGSPISDSDYSSGNTDTIVENLLYSAIELRWENHKSSYRSAVTKLEKAISIDPLNIPAHYWLGFCYEGLGGGEGSEDYIHFNKKALSSYQTVIDLDSDYNGAYFNRGQSYLQLGMYKEALKDITRAIIINPNDAYYYRIRGICKQKMGRDYCHDYEKACELGGSYATRPGFEHRWIEEPACNWFEKECK